MIEPDACIKPRCLCVSVSVSQTKKGFHIGQVPIKTMG